MPASNIQWPLPLTRLNPWFPGQFGVPGTANKTGLRQHSSGAVYYVDPNHVDNNDLRDGTDPNAPLTTVAAAIARCQPYAGDVIAVMANNAWQYGRAADGVNIPISEEVTINIPGVRLVGVSQSSSTGVVWTPASNGGTCITVTAIDVSIEGFLFTQGVFAGCNAIAAVWNGITAWGDNLTVGNCVFDDTVDIAISLDYAWYVHIHDNIFWECDDTGIDVVNPGSGAAFLDIHDNIFHNLLGNGAMDLNNTDDSHVYNNLIYNVNAQGGVAATDEGITTAAGQNNMVCGNYFSCILPVAAPGDYNDLNTAAATDAWVGNSLMNGLAITNPT